MNVASNTSLPLMLVTKLTAVLIIRNFRAWVLLAIIIHFLCFSALAVFDLLPRYIDDIYGVHFSDFDTLKFLKHKAKSLPIDGIAFSAGFLDHKFFAHFGPLLICVYFLYFIILQITINQIVHIAIRQRPRYLHSGQLLKLLGDLNVYLTPALFLNANMALRFTRVAIILLLYLLPFAILQLVMVKVLPILSSLNNLHLGIALIYTLSIAGLVTIIFILGRWSLAIPVTVHEDRSVLSSVFQSWRMTRHFKLKMCILNFTAYLTAWIFLYGFTIPITILGPSSLLAFVIWILGLILFPLVPVISLSTCYFAIRFELQGTSPKNNAKCGEGA